MELKPHTGHLNLIFILVFICFSCSQKPTRQDDTNVSINPDLNFSPNILWLVAEDMSPNIPAYGDSTVVTPTLNRLAEEGVVYDNFYSPSPVCAPARAAIITGMYPNSIGAGHMRTGPWYAGKGHPKKPSMAMKPCLMGLFLMKLSPHLK